MSTHALTHTASPDMMMSSDVIMVQGTTIFLPVLAIVVTAQLLYLISLTVY